MILDDVPFKKKGVEAWLNEVNYEALDYYIPTDFALNFTNFIKLVNGSEGEQNKTPPVHLKVMDSFISKKDRIANMMHRGFAKTTLIEYLFLYLGVYHELPDFGQVYLAIYVSDSMDNGVKNMRKNLEYRWENSEFLQQMLPPDMGTKFTDSRWEFINADGQRFIVKGYGAKALSLDTQLFTPTGTTTIGQCQIGDVIMGANGKPTRITKKSDIFHKPMYELQLEDGRSLKVSEDHLNPVVIKSNVHNKARYDECVLTTLDLLEEPLNFSRLRRRRNKPDYVSNENLVFVKNIQPLDFPAKQLPIDPYTLGVVLGDGRIRKDCGSVELTCHKDELAHYHQQIPYEFGALYEDARSNAVTQSIRKLGQALKAMGLNCRGELKFIPYEYMNASIEQRLALVQGLMDTDGTITDSGRTSFTSSSYQLCDDLACLVRSLGGTAKFSKLGTANAYRIEIWIDMQVFRLPRKANRFIPRTKHVAITAIKRIKDMPSQCIAVDNEERQFVADCYFRTHNTGVRGTKELGRRPQIAVMDDLLSDDDARSPTVMATIKDTVYKAIDYAMDPNGYKIIWNGTPFNANDPLYEAVEDGTWEVNVYPVCEKFPCEEYEFRGSWEDRFPYQYVKTKYDQAIASGKIASFNQELMLRIMSEEDRLIKDSDMRWYSLRTLMANLSSFNRYITTDFATSAKQSADFNFLTVWGINSIGDWYWIAGVCKKQTMDKTIDDLFNLVSKFEPQEVGIEVSGQQGGFIPWIMDQMMTRNIWFPLTSSNNSGSPGIKPTTDKMQRFQVAVPMFKQGKVYFPKEALEARDPALLELLNELSLVSSAGFKSKNDDGLDNISQLPLMRLTKPSATVTNTIGSGGLWEDMAPATTAGGLDSYIV